jgi:histone H1/5
MTIKKHVMKAALKRGVETGALVLVKSSYKLSAEAKKPKPKKKAAVAKKAKTVKKTSATKKKKVPSAKKVREIVASHGLDGTLDGWF